MNTNRLQEDRGIPTHFTEIGYINDLLISVKLILHNVAHEDPNPLTAQRLAEWPLVHRTHFSGCSIFRHDFSYTPKREHRNDIHREDITRIDIFIKALQKGLEEGHIAKYVTESDVNAIGLTRTRLEACVERTVWK
jgi:hypothetical protein